MSTSHANRIQLKAIRDKDIRKIVRAAVAQGFEVVIGRKGAHPRILSPQGRTVGVCPTTPGDRRALANTLADLRRAGFVWPPVKSA